MLTCYALTAQDITKYTWRVTTSLTILRPFLALRTVQAALHGSLPEITSGLEAPADGVLTNVLDKPEGVYLWQFSCSLWHDAFLIFSRGSGSMQLALVAYLWKNDGKSSNFLPSVRGALWFPHIGSSWKKWWEVTFLPNVRGVLWFPGLFVAQRLLPRRRFPGKRPANTTKTGVQSATWLSKGIILCFACHSLA